nr:ABC transporter permease [Pyrinomonadaceae bacterium]
GFSLVAIFAIALGIGANTTIFSAVNALLLRPFAFRDVDRIITVWETVPQVGIEHGSVAPANFLDIKREITAFDSAAVMNGWSANLTEGDKPERIEGATVSPAFFSVLGVGAKEGRTFTTDEERPGSNAVVVISDALWRRRFNSDPKMVGRVVPINNRSFTIVGVMPKELAYPVGGVEMWTPFIFDDEDVQDRNSHYLRVLARLKPGATIEQAQSEMNALGRRLAEQYPQTNANRNFLLETIVDRETRGPRPYLLLMLGAVAFVLLIGCANVANLLLLRATVRGREIAIRTALGASRLRIVRQLLTESLLIALAGGGVGLLLSVWMIDFLRKGLPPNFVVKLVSGWDNLGIDWRVFAFTFLLSLLTGVVFGLVPALQTSKTNLNESLKEGGRSATDGRGSNRTRSLLVVSEVALSLVLLAGAGLMIRSFINMLNVKPGFNANNVMTADITLPRLKYTEPEQRVNFYKNLLDRASTLPGVTAAAAINYIPVGWSNTDTGFYVEGRGEPPQGQAPLAYFQVISPNYFDAMQIPLLQGRAITERDAADAPLVVVISNLLAREYFGNENPLGKRLRFGGEKSYEIVGVVGDVRHEAYSERVERPELAVYVPHAQSAWNTMTIVMRTRSSDQAGVIPALQAEVGAIDKDQPIFNVRTMNQIITESMAPQRLSAFLFGGFAVIALLLAGVGIYAVISYSIAQRTHEIGIRMALGAQAGDIFRLVVKQSMTLILVGIVIGGIGAFAVTRLMASILYGVRASDPVTFSCVALLLGGIAFLACYIPARRATRIDPMVALRYE